MPMNLARSVDQQVLGDAPQKAAGVDQAVPLGAACCPCEHLLHQIGRFLRARLATQKLEERRGMFPKCCVQITCLARCWLALNRTVVRMGVACRRHRERVTFGRKAFPFWR